MSCLVPLIEAGFIDWIVSHRREPLPRHALRPGHGPAPGAARASTTCALRENQVIRIYDIVFDYENLLGTDRFYRTLCRGEAFQKTMGTAEFHHLVGKYLAAREDETGRKGKSLLAAAYRPRRADLHVQSPGDSSHRHEPGRAAARRRQAARSTRCAT